MTSAEAKCHYGVKVESSTVPRELQRMGRRFGEPVPQRVWEGMPTEVISTSTRMEGFHDRNGTPVPWDVEQRNEQSVQRSTEAASDATAAGSTQVPESVRDVISSPGQSLDASIQRAMEERMGDSLGDVRIHTGAKAAAACDAIDARAFTVGNHVAFDSGEYDPSSPEGQHVLAHELAHVHRKTRFARLPSLPSLRSRRRQQTGGAVSMLPQEGVELEVDPDPALEREAEETAQRVLQGGELGIQRLRGTGVHVQRIPEDRVFEALALFEGELDDESLSETRETHDRNQLNHLYEIANDVIEKQSKEDTIDAMGEWEQSGSASARQFAQNNVPSGSVREDIEELQADIDADLEDVALTEDQRHALYGQVETDGWDSVAWGFVKKLLAATVLPGMLFLLTQGSKAAQKDVDERGTQTVAHLRRGEIASLDDFREVWMQTDGDLAERAEQIEQEIRDGTWLEEGEDPFPGGDE